MIKLIEIKDLDDVRIFKFDQSPADMSALYEEVEGQLKEGEYISHTQHDYRLGGTTFDVVVKLEKRVARKIDIIFWAIDHYEQEGQPNGMTLRDSVGYMLGQYNISDHLTPIKREQLMVDTETAYNDYIS
jgi:hypothetical protein